MGLFRSIITPLVIDATVTTHGDGSLAPTNTLGRTLVRKTDMPSPAQLKFALKVDVSHDDSDSPAPPPSPREEEEGAGLSMRSLLGVAVAEQAKRLSPATIPLSATPPPTKSPREHCDAPLASSLPASRAVSRRPSSAFLTGVEGRSRTCVAYRPSTPAALYYLSRSAPGSTSVSRGELVGAARHRRPRSSVTEPPSVLPSRPGSPGRYSKPTFGQFSGQFYDVRCSRTGTPRGGAGAKGTPKFHSVDHMGSTRRFNREKCYEGKVNADVQRGQYGGVFYDVGCSRTGTPRWQTPTASFGKRRPSSATELRVVMHRRAASASRSRPAA